MPNPRRSLKDCEDCPELVILPDVSHFAMLQDPAGYTKAVLDFLGGM